MNEGLGELRVSQTLFYMEIRADWSIYEKSNDFQLEFYYLAMSEIYKTDKIEAYYYDLNNTLLINETALDKKLELLCEKFNEIKEISKDEISFLKCEDKTNCQYCAYAVICNRE